MTMKLVTDELIHMEKFLRNKGEALPPGLAELDKKLAAIECVGRNVEAGMFADFDSHADLLLRSQSWSWDFDPGALVLENFAANESARPGTRRFYLQKALSRAERYASWSTSGSEGLSRSLHVQELKYRMAGLPKGQ
jgi:hypothetical protein